MAKSDDWDRLTPDEAEESLRAEFRSMGFIGMKALAEKRGVASGVMQCLLCQTGRVRFSIAACNGHMAARCSTDGCINAME